MRSLIYILIGIVFGTVMTKAEIVSWFRIYEMFRFEAFHMYGIIGSAVILGAICVFFIKKLNLKAADGNSINFTPKENTWKEALFGGTIFGLGWALTGACPGPLYVLLGNGYVTILLVIAGALLGTLSFGMVKSKLPK